MKTQLTNEQSQHLIDLGVPKEKASAVHITKYGEAITDKVGNVLSTNNEQYPIFTLTDLLEILPKEIEGRYINHSLCMNYGCDMPESEHNLWFVYYDDLNDLEPKYAEELIDSLYKLCVWCLEQGYLKFE